jgi:hypothetical protein
MTFTHFARILDDAGITKCIAILTDAAGGSLDGLMNRDDDTIRVRAPDGDEVFIALKSRPNVWICRLHREVFTE